MIRTETPEQKLWRLAAETYEVLQVADRKRFHRDFGTERLSFSLHRTKETVSLDPDLPLALRFARPYTRDVYAALKALRAEVAADAHVRPVDIKARMERGDAVKGAHSIHSVNHSLRELAEKDLAHSHPARGWVLGCRQPSLPGLPVTSGQTDPPSDPEIRSYRERMADAGVRRFSGGSVMSKQRIWVPGERDEYSGCVLVTDAVTDEVVGVNDWTRIGEMKLPRKLGGLRTVPAVAGFLVRVEDKYMVVRLPGGKEVSVRLLDDWHLAGHTGPQPEAAGAV